MAVVKVIWVVAALLLSLAILLVGHGLQQTMLPLDAAGQGWSAIKVAMIGSVYFLGFISGCFYHPALVSRVGHIRLFMVLASAAAGSLLMLALTDNYLFWLLIRFITGWAFSGLYMVIECWLNEVTENSQRGLVLSLYTTLSLLGICVGQLLLSLSFEVQEQYYVLGAFFLVMAVVPVGLTRSPEPKQVTELSLKVRRLFEISHVAVAGAFLGGIVTGGIWSIGPVYGLALGLEKHQIGWLMALMIAGGASLQIPFGKLSDLYDRRLVIALVSLLGGMVAMAIVLWGDLSMELLMVLIFLFGGCTFPLYALCAAHANDNAAISLVEVAGGILLLNATGSVLGPIIMGLLMAYTPDALFLVALITLSGLCGYSVSRMQHHSVLRRFFQPFQGLPKTSQSIAELAKQGVQSDIGEPRASGLIVD